MRREGRSLSWKRQVSSLAVSIVLIFIWSECKNVADASTPRGAASLRRSCETDWRPSVLSWGGGVNYCARLGGRLCTRDEYCPGGAGSEPLGGFRVFPSLGGSDIANADGVRPVRQWAPTSDGINSWVMLSNVSSEIWPTIGLEAGSSVDPPCSLAGESDLGVIGDEDTDAPKIRSYGEWLAFDLIGNHDVAGFDTSKNPPIQFQPQTPPAVTEIRIHFAVLDQNATAEFVLQTSQDNHTWLTVSENLVLNANLQTHIHEHVATTSIFGSRGSSSTGWTTLTILSFSVSNGVATAKYVNTSAPRFRAGDVVKISGASISSFDEEVIVIRTPTETMFQFRTSIDDTSTETKETACTGSVNQVHARYWRMLFTNCTNLNVGAESKSNSYVAIAGVSFIPSKHCAVNDLSVNGLQGYEALGTRVLLHKTLRSATRYIRLR